MGATAGLSTMWWRDGGALTRFVGDLVADELSRLRKGRSVFPARPWPAALALDGDGLGVDSLELLSLGAAFTEAIHLHETGIEDYLLARRTIGDWVAIAAAGLERFHTRLTFRTSGSTGQPKPCTHELDGLLQEIESQRVLFPEVRRIVSAVPSHHIYGFLFNVLLPHRLGGLEFIDIRASSPAHLATSLDEGDLVVGHPEFWHAVIRAVPQLPAGVVGVTSTAPCPAETAEALIALGLSRLVQVYGSSETAGVAWRTSPAAPYELYGHWRRSGGGAVASIAGDGDAEAPVRCHELPDRIEWLDDRHFRLKGRSDSAVQVAGINVFPERVRQVLREHPAVEDAAVRLMRPEEGNRLKAFIVPKIATDFDELRASLDKWVDARLTTPERPRAFSFGPALPAGPMGKAVDWLLP